MIRPGDKILSFKLSAFLPLLFLGLLIEGIYLFFLRFFPLSLFYSQLTEVGSLTRYTPIWLGALLFAFLLLFFAFGLAVKYIAKYPSKHRLLFILLSTGIFGITLSFVYPLTATELYSTLAQIKLLVIYHQNPFIISPAAYVTDPVLVLAGSASRVVSSPGPLEILLSAAVYLFSKDSLTVALLAFKLFFSLFLVLSAFVAYKVAFVLKSNKAFALSAALFVGWNPLLLFITNVLGQGAIVMFCLLLCTLYLYFKGKYISGNIILVLAVLMRWESLLLIPLFGLYGFFNQQKGKRRIVFFTSFLLACLSCISVYAPFWQGWETFSGFFKEQQIHYQSFSGIFGNFSRLLFIPFYIYCVWYAKRGKEQLLQASFLTFVFFIIFGMNQFHLWYIALPTIFAAFLSGRYRVTSIILSISALFVSVSFSYVWAWMPAQNPTTFGLLGVISYGVIILPAILYFYLSSRVERAS